MEAITARGADFSDTLMVTVWLVQADFTGASLVRATLPLSQMNDIIAVDADMRRADLTRAHLAGSDFSGANLSGACLSSANLSGAQLNSTMLSHVSLHSADLTNASLINAELVLATLHRACLSGANFTRSIFSGTILSECEGLDTVCGLDEIQHAGNSAVDIRTALSMLDQGRLPFLTELGYAEGEIARLRPHPASCAKDWD